MESESESKSQKISTPHPGSKTNMVLESNTKMLTQEVYTHTSSSSSWPYYNTHQHKSVQYSTFSSFPHIHSTENMSVFTRLKFWLICQSNEGRQVQQKHTKYRQINANKSTHSEMGPV